MEKIKSDDEFAPPIAPETQVELSIIQPDGRRATAKMTLTQIKDLRVMGIDVAWMLIGQLDAEIETSRHLDLMTLRTHVKQTIEA